MKRIIKEGNTVAILIFLVGVLLFNWPLLSIQVKKNGFQLFFYLFLLWFLLILCLGLYSRYETTNLPKTRCDGDDQ